MVIKLDSPQPVFEALSIDDIPDDEVDRPLAGFALVGDLHSYLLL